MTKTVAAGQNLLLTKISAKKANTQDQTERRSLVCSSLNLG